MCDPQQAAVADASFLELVLECNQQDSLGDSFSTLGLHSIFSEEDCQSVVSQKNSQKKNRKKKSKGAAATTGKCRLDNVVEDEQDNLNLRAMIREGSSSQAKSYSLTSPSSAGHLAGGAKDEAPLCPGDRWFDSTSKSKSCRNFCYDASAAGDGNDQQVSASCRAIVSQALEITELTPPAFAQMGMSMSCLDVYSRTEGPGDAPPSVPSRGNGRLAGGESSGNTRVQSCRNPGGDGGVTITNTNCPPLSPGGATARISNSRIRRALSSASGKLGTSSKSPPDKRKTMLSMGKSLSARYIIDTSDRALPARITVRSKSVRHVSSRTSHENSADGGTMPLSPIVRSSKRLSSREFKDSITAPSLNGRKFVSYSRSLSRKDLDGVNEVPGKAVSSIPLQPEEVCVPAITAMEIRRVSALDVGRTVSVPNAAADPRHVSAPDVGRTISGSLAGFLEKTCRSQQTELPGVLVANTSRRKLQAKSKSFRHVPGGQMKCMLPFGKSLSAKNLTEVDAGSLPELAPMSSGIKTAPTSRLSSADVSLQTASDVISIPSVSTVTMSVSDWATVTVQPPGLLSDKLSSDSRLTRKTDTESLPSLAPMTKESPGPLSVKLSSAEPLKKEADVESLPSLAPMTPIKSPGPVRPAWVPSTTAVPEISTLPLVVEGGEKVEAQETHATNDTTVDQVNSDHPTEARPVYSTEEIRKEVGSLHMKDLYVTSYREKSSRRSGRLAATRASQSCRRLSSAKKEPSQRELNASSEHDKVRQPARRGMKKDASRRKVAISSELDSNKHASSRNLSKGNREKPKLKKQRSGGSPRKSSRKQASSRKLLAAHSEGSAKANGRSSHKREKSTRNISSNTPPKASHPSQSSQHKRESRSQKETRETSPNCVSLYVPEKKTVSTPPVALHRVERASIKRDCSVRSRSKSKSGSRRRTLNASFRVEERSMKESENANRENSMRDWNSSFRKRCKSFQGTSNAPDDTAAPEIVW